MSGYLRRIVMRMSPAAPLSLSVPPSPMADDAGTEVDIEPMEQVTPISLNGSSKAAAVPERTSSSSEASPGSVRDITTEDPQPKAASPEAISLSPPELPLGWSRSLPEPERSSPVDRPGPPAQEETAAPLPSPIKEYRERGVREEPIPTRRRQSDLGDRITQTAAPAQPLALPEQLDVDQTPKMTPQQERVPLTPPESPPEAQTDPLQVEWLEQESLIVPETQLLLLPPEREPPPPPPAQSDGPGLVIGRLEVEVVPEDGPAPPPAVRPGPAPAPTRSPADRSAPSSLSFGLGQM